MICRVTRVTSRARVAPRGARSRAYRYARQPAPTSGRTQRARDTEAKLLGEERNLIRGRMTRDSIKHPLASYRLLMTFLLDEPVRNHYFRTKLHLDGVIVRAASRRIADTSFFFFV